MRNEQTLPNINRENPHALFFAFVDVVNVAPVRPQITDIVSMMVQIICPPPPSQPALLLSECPEGRNGSYGLSVRHT